jgi:hypothetical protein
MGVKYVYRIYGRVYWTKVYYGMATKESSRVMNIR